MHRPSKGRFVGPERLGFAPNRFNTSPREHGPSVADAVSSWGKWPPPSGQTPTGICLFSWASATLLGTRCCSRDLVSRAGSSESPPPPAGAQPSPASPLHAARAVSSSSPGGDPSTGTVATEETRSESELLFLPDYLILSSCETGRLHHARYALRPTALACLLHTCSRRLPRAGRFAPASSRGCVCRDRDPYQPLQRPKHVAHQTK